MATELFNEKTIIHLLITKRNKKSSQTFCFVLECVLSFRIGDLLVDLWFSKFIPCSFSERNMDLFCFSGSFRRPH